MDQARGSSDSRKQYPSRLQLVGKVSLHVSRAGRLVHQQSGNNIVTSLGIDLAASNFEADSGKRITHAAIGDGVSSPQESDTALANEIAGTRVAKTSSSVISNNVSYIFEWVASATWTMNEVGLFTAVAGGDLVARFLTQVFNFQIGDEMELNWSLEFEGNN